MPVNQSPTNESLSSEDQQRIAHALRTYRSNLPLDTHEQRITPLLNRLDTQLSPQDKDTIAAAIYEHLTLNSNSVPNSDIEQYIELLNELHTESVLEVYSESQTIVVHTDHFYEYRFFPQRSITPAQQITFHGKLLYTHNTQTDTKHSPSERSVPDAVQQALTPALKEHADMAYLHQ